MKTVFDLSRDEIVALTDEEVGLYVDKELAGKGIPIEAKNWNIKDKKKSCIQEREFQYLC